VNLVSGATGFIGRRILEALINDHSSCMALSRRPVPGVNTTNASLADISALTATCAGVETLFHCAGYAHALSSLSGEDAEQHWRINFEGTRNLVEAAGNAGVRTFVFLSSVKAMAEPGKACADEDYPGEPVTAYGQSKHAAEDAVLEAGTRYGMHVVNLRLTMVYGSGGRGNLERMARMVRKGWFPPLPETDNRRSLVHVEDVVSAMRLVAKDPRANGGTYIIAGPEAPSGRALFDALRAAQGLPPCSWAVPEWSLKLAANVGDTLETLFKKRLPLDSETLDRLLGSAWYSSARIERELGWRAKVSLEEGLREMIRQ
jgi:UDP-glucose 4-epimerase